MEKVETGCSDMELIMDMLCDGTNNVHEDLLEGDQPAAYYEGKALNILQQLKTKDDYFHFLKTILKNYPSLDESQKKEIIRGLDIKPQVIVKEKVVSGKKKSKNNKPKLNNHDDY
jgi:hypothetical protein